MTPPHESDRSWMVVIENLAPDGSPYRDGAPFRILYRNIPGGSQKEAIAFVLDRFIAPLYGKYRATGWRPVAGWAFLEHADVVVETIVVDPVDMLEGDACRGAS